MVLHPRTIVVMLEDVVRFQVAMDDNACVPVVLFFVQVFGRHDREQSQRDAEHACENLRPLHGVIVCDSRTCHN